MNDISVFIYLLCFAAVFGMTCVYMAMMMRSTLSDFDKRPVKSYGDVMKSYRHQHRIQKWKVLKLERSCWYSHQRKMRKMMIDWNINRPATKEEKRDFLLTILRYSVIIPLMILL